VNLAVHFIKARSSLILSCFSRSPLFIYYAICGVMEGEENCGWVERRVGEIGQFSLTGRIVFHILFML